MRARAVLQDSLRAAKRLAGTGLDDLNNKEIFLSSFRLFLWRQWRQWIACYGSDCWGERCGCEKRHGGR